MIRIGGAAVLGLMLNTCPFESDEKPDGYAELTGTVMMRDGTPFTGRGHVRCANSLQDGPSFAHTFDTDRDGSYRVTLVAPFAAGPRPGGNFEFICHVQVLAGGPLASRNAWVPFSPLRAARPTTRVDLRQGDIAESR